MRTLLVSIARQVAEKIWQCSRAFKKTAFTGEIYFENTLQTENLQSKQRSHKCVVNCETVPPQSEP